MTIRRESDFLGIVFSRRVSVTGTLERLIEEGRLGGQVLTVRISQPDGLRYSAGSFDSFDPDREVLSSTQSIQEILKGSKINDYDLSSKRSWYGVRVRYRWYADGENLRVLPPSEKSESPQDT